MSKRQIRSVEGKWIARRHDDWISNIYLVDGDMNIELFADEYPDRVEWAVYMDTDSDAVAEGTVRAKADGRLARAKTAAAASLERVLRAALASAKLSPQAPVLTGQQADEESA